MPHKSGYAACTGVLRENISMTDNTAILDMCCGSRMFWFNKRDTRAVFTDIRAKSTNCATVDAWLSAPT